MKDTEKQLWYLPKGFGICIDNTWSKSTKFISNRLTSDTQYRERVPIQEEEANFQSQTKGFIETYQARPHNHHVIQHQYIKLYNELFPMQMQKQYYIHLSEIVRRSHIFGPFSKRLSPSKEFKKKYIKNILKQNFVHFVFLQTIYTEDGAETYYIGGEEIYSQENGCRHFSNHATYRILQPDICKLTLSGVWRDDNC